MKILTRKDLRFIRGDSYSWNVIGTHIYFQGYGPTRLLYGKPRKLRKEERKNTREGTKIHRRLEEDRKGELDGIMTVDAGGVVYSEVLLRGKILGLDIVGFVDKMIVYPDNTFEVIELKTTKFDPEEAANKVSQHKNQLGMYAKLGEEYYNMTCRGGKIIYLHRVDGRLNGDHYVKDLTVNQLRNAYLCAELVAKRNIQAERI